MMFILSNHCMLFGCNVTITHFCGDAFQQSSLFFLKAVCFSVLQSGESVKSVLSKLCTGTSSLYIPVRLSLFFHFSFFSSGAHVEHLHTFIILTVCMKRRKLLSNNQIVKEYAAQFAIVTEYIIFINIQEDGKQRQPNQGCL